MVLVVDSGRIGKFEIHFGNSAMKNVYFLTTAALALAVVSATSANAKGVIKGAVVGATAGHFVGHGHAKSGAVAGAVIGHHHAQMKAAKHV
jgi:outer membrane lipoprotein SlyB